MAERKKAREGGSSGRSKASGGSKSSERARGSGKGRREGRALSTGAGERRSGAAKRKEAEGRSQARSEGGDGSAAQRLAKAETAGKPMGRPPEEEPDVFVDVPNVHVGKLDIDVERLQAHLALRAQVANLLNLVAGVHVDVDKVKIDIEDVDATALLKVRLHNTYNILDRTLTTLDENPEFLQGVLDTADTAVGQTGAIGREATKPGGALSELTSGVGDSVGALGGMLGDTLTSVTDKGNPKQLLSGKGGGASGARSKMPQRSVNGKLAKAAARIAAGGIAGLLGGALYRASRRPRVLGVPIGRKRGLERVTKQIG